MTGASVASVTNQKLDAARRLIQQSQASEEAWLSAGLESSALFQLRSALNGLIQEVCSNYGLTFSTDIVTLFNAVEAKQLVIPVLSELASLVKQPNSWLSQLEQAYRAQYECRPLGAVQLSDNLIGKGSDDGASTALYLAKLVELVLRFREESAEY